MSPPFEDPDSGPQNMSESRGTTAFTGMRYFDAYSFVFDSPRWAMNLLLGAVCLFIPIVGQIVLMGYQFEIIESLHRDPKRIYPDFDFNYFVEYLKRGVWPFLVSLVVGFVVSFVLMFLYLVMLVLVAVCAFLTGDEAGMAIGMAGFFLVYVVLIAASAIVWLVEIPMVVRAGLAQDFGEAFRLEYIKSFFRKTWKEIAFGGLFMMVSGMAVGMIGTLLCFVGLYPAIALFMLAQCHFYYQLYQVYLARGGKPIPLKPPLATIV